MKRKHSYTYIATTTTGELRSITAPNAKVARVVAQNSAEPIRSCQRAFKRGGMLGHQIMKKSDCLLSL